MLDRRAFLTKTASTTALLAAAGAFRGLRAVEPRRGPEMLIRKTPGCGCCQKWADHLAEGGIEARVEEHPDMSAYKDELEIPEELRSCHTGLIEGYAVEGHVPVEDVLRLLESRPDVRGIAVPGMPMGSPGMEMGDRVDPYEVIAFGGPEGSFVFAEHG